MKTKSFFITRWIIAMAIVSFLIACYFQFHIYPHLHSEASTAVVHHEGRLHHDALVQSVIIIFTCASYILGATYIGAIAIIVWLLGFLVPRKSENAVPEIPC